MKDATGLKYKLEAKDGEIKDFKKLLKTKQEELSEMQVTEIIRDGPDIRFSIRYPAKSGHFQLSGIWPDT